MVIQTREMDNSSSPLIWTFPKVFPIWEQTSSKQRTRSDKRTKRKMPTSGRNLDESQHIGPNCLKTAPVADSWRMWVGPASGSLAMHCILQAIPWQHLNCSLIAVTQPPQLPWKVVRHQKKKESKKWNLQADKFQGNWHWSQGGDAEIEKLLGSL